MRLQFELTVFREFVSRYFEKLFNGQRAAVTCDLRSNKTLQSGVAEWQNAINVAHVLTRINPSHTIPPAATWNIVAVPITIIDGAYRYVFYYYCFLRLQIEKNG